MKPDTDQDTPTRQRPSTTREDPAQDCPDHVGGSPPPSCSRYCPQRSMPGPTRNLLWAMASKDTPGQLTNRDTAFRSQSRGAQLPEAPGGTGPRSGQCTPRLKAPVASQAWPPWQWEPPGWLQQQNRRDQLSCNPCLAQCQNALPEASPGRLEGLRAPWRAQPGTEARSRKRADGEEYAPRLTEGVWETCRIFLGIYRRVTQINSKVVGHKFNVKINCMSLNLENAEP